MTANELYQLFRHDDVLRRRRMGWQARIAERETRIRVLNEWMTRWGDSGAGAQ